MNQDQYEVRKPWITPRRVITTLFILLIVAAGGAVYFYQQAKSATADPSVQSASELQDTIKAVGKLIVLPTNETPTLATVTDPDKLKDQAFFANAKKGDKVLIYTTSHKAILYDPTQNKIVEVAPINLGNTQTTP